MTNKLNTFIWVGLLAFYSTALLAAPETLKAKQNQVRIAVMGQGDFHPDRAVKGNVRSLPDDLAARFIERLSATKRFEVVERTALRRVVREQGFSKKQSATDLDKVIEKTVDNLPDMNGWTIAAAGAVADHNDSLKEFRDLGTTVGADYIVYAVLEKHQTSKQTKAIPFSETGRVQVKNQVDARLRLRVIETKQGRIIGADSIHTKISESVFNGTESSQDAYSMYDHLGSEAAISVLDMVFPPTVVSKSPWVINRGVNERVKQGDRYTLVREGKEVKDAAGVVIGRVRSNVGVVEVAQVQATLAVVSLLEGELAINDLVVPIVAEMKVDTVSTPLKNPSSSTKQALPRLAVGLVKVHSTATTGVDASKHISSFTDTLISNLSQTKRFQLIDRQEVDQLLDEQVAQAMAGNREMPSALGQLKGADYLVIGSIARFEIDEKTIKLPSSSRVFTMHEGRVEGNMRIVDARTGEILESKKISVIEKVKKATSQNILFTQLADAYASQVTVNLMNAIYPIKIAAIVSRVAYINRGIDGGLYIGETLKVVRPGQAIIDPDTNVQLGFAEEKIGELTLDEVEGARSTASVGPLPLQIGDVLKRSAGLKGLRSGQTVANDASTRTGGKADVEGDKALTLAVGKVRINPRVNKAILDQSYSSRMTNELMVKLSQLQEFDVMERAEIDQVLDEKTFIAISGGTSIEDKLGELQGADYLVSSAIDAFKLRTETSKIPYSDERQTRYFGTVEATARLIDVHTGKLVSAVKVRINERLRNVSTEEIAINDLIDMFSSELTDRIKENLVSRQKGDAVTLVEKREVVQPKQVNKVNRPNF